MIFRVIYITTDRKFKEFSGSKGILGGYSSKIGTWRLESVRCRYTETGLFRGKNARSCTHMHNRKHYGRETEREREKKRERDRLSKRQRNRETESER